LQRACGVQQIVQHWGSPCANARCVVSCRRRRMDKIENDKKGECFVAVFKVNDLTSKKNRYKVDINASENHLTGAVVHTEGLVRAHRDPNSENR
jgi:hypothetical protein